MQRKSPPSIAEVDSFEVRALREPRTGRIGVEVAHSPAGATFVDLYWRESVPFEDAHAFPSTLWSLLACFVTDECEPGRSSKGGDADRQ